MPLLTRQLTKLVTRSADNAACLIFVDDGLTAVLTRLDDLAHGDECGSWFLEAGFGPCEVLPPLIFDSIDAGEAWVLAQHDDRMSQSRP